jgi:hypothetical protein
MPDIEKLIEKCLFTPKAVTVIEDVSAIFYYFGYQRRGRPPCLPLNGFV